MNLSGYDLGTDICADTRRYSLFAKLVVFVCIIDWDLVKDHYVRALNLSSKIHLLQHQLLRLRLPKVVLILWYIDRLKLIYRP